MIGAIQSDMYKLRFSKNPKKYSKMVVAVVPAIRVKTREQTAATSRVYQQDTQIRTRTGELRDLIFSAEAIIMRCRNAVSLSKRWSRKLQQRTLAGHTSARSGGSGLPETITRIHPVAIAWQG
jgi:hypothetical protein